MVSELLPRCPECGSLMRQANRGLTFKKRGPAYVCPVAEANTLRDSSGQIFRMSGDRHTRVQPWRAEELLEALWARGIDRRRDDRRRAAGPYEGVERRRGDRRDGGSAERGTRSAERGVTGAT
jgi:hypothetical protein